MAAPSSLEGPVKLFGLLMRRHDLTLDAFSAHWRTTHAREALKLAGFFERYVQNHVAAEPLARFARPCDGAPELWFRRYADAAAMGQSPEYMTGAYLDEPNFMEGRSIGLVTREVQISPGPPLPLGAGAVKVLILWRRAAHLSPDDFREAFVAQTRPLALAQGRFVRFVRSLGLAPGGDDEPLYDGVEELWWRTAGDFEADRSAIGRAPEGAALVDVARSAGGRIEEHYVHWPSPAPAQTDAASNG